MRTAEKVAPEPEQQAALQWMMRVQRIAGRATWIRAAAACRPRSERAAIFALSVFDDAIDGFPCAYPDCKNERSGALCNSHHRQARRREGFAKMSPLVPPTRKAEARAPIARAPIAMRLLEPCRVCGVADWHLSEQVRESRPSPVEVRKCRECVRRRRKAGFSKERKLGMRGAK